MLLQPKLCTKNPQITGESEVARYTPVTVNPKALPLFWGLTAWTTIAIADTLRNATPAPWRIRKTKKDSVENDKTAPIEAIK